MGGGSGGCWIILVTSEGFAGICRWVGPLGRYLKILESLSLIFCAILVRWRYLSVFFWDFLFARFWCVLVVR